MRRTICIAGGLVVLVLICRHWAVVAPESVPDEVQLVAGIGHEPQGGAAALDLIPDELPPGWSLAEVARGTPPLYGFDLSGVSILA
jgi:hypothetical protein